MSRPHFLRAALNADGPWALQIVRSRALLASHAVLAGTSETRRKGLLGREALPSGHALVIAPTQGIHTFGMKFPLDVVGVNRDGAVVSIKHAVPRWRVVLSWRAFSMVELAAGTCAAAGLDKGDHLEVVIPESENL